MLSMNSHSPHGRHFGGLGFVFISNYALLATHPPFWRASELFPLKWNRSYLEDKWREKEEKQRGIRAISPKSRQSGEIRISSKKDYHWTYKGLNEGITEGVIEGITEGVKKSMIQIVSVILTEKNIRASEIAEKLNKSYKTLERHIAILKQLKVIEYKGSNRAGGYEITKEFSALLKDK